MTCRSCQVELAEPPAEVSLEGAVVRRPGDDVSLVTYGGSPGQDPGRRRDVGPGRGVGEVLGPALPAATRHGALVATASRTHRVVVVDEGWRSGSLSAEVAARVMDEAFYELDAPVGRVCSAEVPVPYAKHLEEAALPQVDTIVAAARRALIGDG